MQLVLSILMIKIWSQKINDRRILLSKAFKRVKNEISSENCKESDSHKINNLQMSHKKN